MEDQPVRVTFFIKLSIISLRITTVVRVRVVYLRASLVLPTLFNIAETFLVLLLLIDNALLLAPQVLPKHVMNTLNESE